jgi:hypothetical protein
MSGEMGQTWLGSRLSLAAAGVRYTGDWNHDDLPVRLRVKTGEMHGLPYGNEINDIRFSRAATPATNTRRC